MGVLTCFEEYPLWAGRLDGACAPAMCLCMGWLNERPQETHYWNNRLLTQAERARLDLTRTIFDAGDYRTRWGDRIRAQVSRIPPLFHIWVLGGWNQYLVVCPKNPTEEWYIGWMTPFRSWGGVSLIPIVDRSVRVLLGPTWMGFAAFTRNGEQIPLEVLGKGRLGDGEWRHVRLR